MKILLVEDSLTQALQVMRSLEEIESYEVRHVTHLSDALNILKTGEFELVLLDLMLPGSSGADTVRIICSEFPNIPVVVLTSADDDELLKKALEIGAQDYLVKGRLISELFRRSFQYAVYRKRSEEQLRRDKIYLEHQVEKRTKDLRESEERFRNLVEKTSDWVWEVDGNFVYTYANPKAYDILGFERKEILGKTLFDFTPREEVEHVTDDFKNIAKMKRQFNNMENTNIHKDGHLVVLETSGVPVLSKNKKFLGFRGISRDITIRKQTEDKARKLERLTPREREVLELVIAGQTNKGVARKLGISDKTVEFHRSRVMAKMEAKTLADLVKMAFLA